MRLSQIGCWVLGAFVVVLGLLCLGIVFGAGLHLNGRAEYAAAVPSRLPGLYLALKEHAVLVTGLLGFATFAWSCLYRNIKLK